MCSSDLLLAGLCRGGEGSLGGGDQTPFDEVGKLFALGPWKRLGWKRKGPGKKGEERAEKAVQVSVPHLLGSSLPDAVPVPGGWGTGKVGDPGEEFQRGTVLVVDF